MRGTSSLDETLMAATALRRLGREHDAVALLGIVEEEVVGGGDDLSCGRFCLERAVALASLGDASAGRSFGLARAFLLRTDAPEAPAVLAEVALQEALAAWNEGERTLAISTLERAEMAPGPATRAGARHLRGEIAASDLDFHAQLDGVHETLRELASASEPDVWLEATTLHTLAHVAIELDERHVTKLVHSRADALEWTPATAAMEFDVLRMVGWYEVLRGDATAGRALVKRAGIAAPTDRERVAALVDVARLAKIDYDTRAREKLDAAGTAADAAQWEDAPISALEALLELAELYGESDAERSLAFLQRYRDARRYSMSLAYHQPVTGARERFWFGAGALARGERDAARQHLQHAFDFWCTVAFLPRAAIAANMLRALGPHAAAQAFLTQHLDRWPGTFLHDRMKLAIA